MSRPSYRSLNDATLLREFSALVTQDWNRTADLIACMAEVDSRKLYLPEGYASMFAFCVGRYHMDEGVAYRRIRAARMARRFPVIIEAIREGRLHLTAIVLLAPHLTQGSSDLLKAAEHKTRREIELLLAQRYPRPDLATRVFELTPASVQATFPVTGELTPASVQAAVPVTEDLTPASVAAVDAPRARVTPLAPQRFGLQVTLSQSAYNNLKCAQELLARQIPGADAAKIVELALAALVADLRKRKCAATDKPRPIQTSRSEPGSRQIPAHVRREVWRRDRSRCTFVSESGHRCEATRFLELDHIEPVARGGDATAKNLRLRCRAHNQYEAERVFGNEFMEYKRHGTRSSTPAYAPAPA